MRAESATSERARRKLKGVASKRSTATAAMQRKGVEWRMQREFAMRKSTGAEVMMMKGVESPMQRVMMMKVFA